MTHKHSYAYFKDLYHNTKPIRGKESQDIRPLGDRAKQHHRVVRVGDAYAARLYETDVVTYYPDGSVTVKTGGWPSKITQEFISENSPFICSRARGRVWLWACTTISMALNPAEREAFTFSSDGQITLRRNEHGCWVGSNGQIPRRMRIDRAGAKAVRDQYKACLNYIKTFLKMSERLVAHEFIKSYADELDMTFARGGYKFFAYRTDAVHTVQTRINERSALLQDLRSTDPEHWNRALAWLAQSSYKHLMMPKHIYHPPTPAYTTVREVFIETLGTVRPMTVNFYDVFLDPKKVLGFIDKLLLSTYDDMWMVGGTA